MTDRQETFDLIKKSAAYAHRHSREFPNSAGAYLGAGCIITFLVVWCLIAVVFTVVFYAVGGECFAAIPALMTVFGIVFLVATFRRMHRYSQAPTEGTPAIVVSKQSRGSENIRNYITLEFENGQRQEYSIGDERQAALIGIGDAGVAFTRLDVFLALDRCP